MNTYKKFEFDEFEEKDLSVCIEQKPETVAEQPFATKCRRSSVTEQIVNVRSWCSAFCAVLNVMDVCDDAKRNFVVKKSEEMSRQNSYECDEEHNENCKKQQCHKNMLNATLLFDDQNNALSTKEKMTAKYRHESSQTDVELMTQ